MKTARIVLFLFLFVVMLSSRITTSYAYKITTFSDQDEFGTAFLNLQATLNTDLNDQGFFAKSYNFPTPMEAWDTRVGYILGSWNENNIFGYGSYFKDFTLPISIEVWRVDPDSANPAVTLFSLD